MTVHQKLFRIFGATNTVFRQLYLPQQNLGRENNRGMVLGGGFYKGVDYWVVMVYSGCGQGCRFFDNNFFEILIFTLILTQNSYFLDKGKKIIKRRHIVEIFL